VPPNAPSKRSKPPNQTNQHEALSAAASSAATSAAAPTPQKRDGTNRAAQERQQVDSRFPTQITSALNTFDKVVALAQALHRVDAAELTLEQKHTHHKQQRQLEHDHAMLPQPLKSDLSALHTVKTFCVPTGQ